MVVLVDAYCTCRDIDSRATGVETEDVFTLLSDFCLVLYSVELCGLLFVRGWEILKDWMIVVDILVVICGYVESILVQVTPSELVQKMSLLRALRLARIFRLMRLLRKIRALRELYKLVTMMSTCLKTLLWSFLFCFVVMTVWAMLIVEVVNPIVLQMDSDGVFDDCSNGFCRVSTSSVLHANLLLFQTVIAGDGWGKMATPIILRHPETAVIFMGSLLTLVFGVLNLIVAVVVDTFAEARQHDILNLAEELEEDLEKDTKFLQKLFQRIDRDGSGRVTFDELIEGARKDPEFQSRLRVMDIDEVDLEQLFQMIDVNGSGSIEASDFIWPLSRWVHDSKTAPRFIKYNMLRTMEMQEELYALSEVKFQQLKEQIDHLTLMLKGRSPGNNFEDLSVLTPPDSARDSSSPAIRIPIPFEDIGAADAPIRKELPAAPVLPLPEEHPPEPPKSAQKVAVALTQGVFGSSVKEVEALLLASEARLKRSMAKIENAISELPRMPQPQLLQPNVGTASHELQAGWTRSMQRPAQSHKPHTKPTDALKHSDAFRSMYMGHAAKGSGNRRSLLAEDTAEELARTHLRTFSQPAESLVMKQLSARPKKLRASHA
mmetsp:Transcript_49147/g.101357  ORF Transcript_49147/g.101357 Transcript_49147/m.101357 type:complete len:604 (+) Transcript_49147:1-1812(+)